MGANAHWWGGKTNETTRQRREGAGPSRTDDVLANVEAVAMIHKVYGIKDDNIPTHAAVGVVASRHAIKESHEFTRTMPSLKVLYKRKGEEVSKDMEGKEKKEVGKKSKQDFHETIDE